jgi:hypothetical protein
MNFIISLYRHFQERRRIRKKLKEFRKRDPFIYK